MRVAFYLDIDCLYFLLKRIEIVIFDRYVAKLFCVGYAQNPYFDNFSKDLPFVFFFQYLVHL